VRWKKDPRTREVQVIPILLFFLFTNSISYFFKIRCVSAGTVDGFCVFNCEPFTKAHEQCTPPSRLDLFIYFNARSDLFARVAEGGGLGICEMLFCTSLVAVVGSGDQVRPALNSQRVSCRVSCVRCHAACVVSCVMGHHLLTMIVNSFSISPPSSQRFRRASCAY